MTYTFVCSADGFSFERIVREWSEGSDRAAYVTVHSAEYYDTCSRFVAVRGGVCRAACAVNRGGELVSVVRLAEGNSDDVDAVIRAALKTGKVRTAECYDGRLLAFYQRYGFVEYARYPWNKDCAPADWNYARDGRPDYLTLALGVSS